MHRRDTKRRCLWTHRCSSIWSTNCIIHRSYPIRSGIRRALWAMQIHPRECMNDMVRCSRSPPAVHPSQLAVCFGRARSRRIFRWYNPCNWNSQRPNRICSRGRGYQNICAMCCANIWMCRRSRKCRPKSVKWYCVKGMAVGRGERRWMKWKGWLTSENIWVWYGMGWNGGERIEKSDPRFVRIYLLAINERIAGG